MSQTPPKIKVAVLYGGRSGEHEVSQQSAASVLQHLDRELFEVVPIGIDKQGHWHLNDLKLLEGHTALPVKTTGAAALVSPDSIANKGQLQSKQNAQNNLFDVVFPVMHGPQCEDGTLQGLLELADVPYVGAGVLASAVAMDKDVSKRLVAAAGIKTPAFITLKKTAWLQDAEACSQRIMLELNYPVFVKPANTGSSVGIHKVKQADELQSAVADAFLYDTKILIEQALTIRELEISVLENSDYGQAPLVSVAGEVAPNLEFYCYAAKYLDERGADLLIPAPLSPEKMREAQTLSAQIFELLECEGMARIDLFMDKITGELYFNEANTLPGFTAISMYPKLWAASGIPYAQLLTHLIELAVARHARKQHLKRDWALSEK